MTTDKKLNVEVKGAIAQLGERLHGMQEVSGSIPLSSTKFSFSRYIRLLKAYLRCDRHRELPYAEIFFQCRIGLEWRRCALGLMTCLRGRGVATIRGWATGTCLWFAG